MTKRTQHIVTGELGVSVEFKPENVYEYDDKLQRLIDSGIVTATDSELTWREGHLEHVARLYVSDPARAWRDYADDLTVAFAHDARFAALVDTARGDE